MATFYSAMVHVYVRLFFLLSSGLKYHVLRQQSLSGILHYKCNIVASNFPQDYSSLNPLNDDSNIYHCKSETWGQQMSLNYLVSNGVCQDRPTGNTSPVYSKYIHNTYIHTHTYIYTYKHIYIYIYIYIHKRTYRHTILHTHI
jgi:hypothetical protein